MGIKQHYLVSTNAVKLLLFSLIVGSGSCSWVGSYLTFIAQIHHRSNWKDVGQWVDFFSVNSITDFSSLLLHNNKYFLYSQFSYLHWVVFSSNIIAKTTVKHYGNKSGLQIRFKLKRNLCNRTKIFGCSYGLEYKQISNEIQTSEFNLSAISAPLKWWRHSNDLSFVQFSWHSVRDFNKKP